MATNFIFRNTYAKALNLNCHGLWCAGLPVDHLELLDHLELHI